MADGLNHYIAKATYGPVAVPSKSPSSTDVARYKARLVQNVNDGWGIAGDVVEVEDSGLRLVGHPNETIYHWIAIRGYTSNGNYTAYADPAGQSPAVTWGKNVPRYSTMSSSTIMKILGERGYIW
jgi:hypothetical protein